MKDFKLVHKGIERMFGPTVVKAANKAQAKLELEKILTWADIPLSKIAEVKS